MKENIAKDKIPLPEGYQLSAELSEAYNLMEYSKNSLFITGRAGTGKSSLLNYFRKNTGKKVVTLASTGLAAIQVGGVTIHSFFGFPLRSLRPHDPDIKKWNKSHPKAKIFQKLDCLVIDEISMVRADILDGIDYSLRVNMNNNLPFGGKQVIFVGDVFQLSPVAPNQDHQLQEHYANIYFFSARVFQNHPPGVVELNKIYRQQDDNFIHFLNKIRAGSAPLEDIENFNQACSQCESETFSITLCCVNAIADQVNEKKLNDLDSLQYFYDGQVERTFNERQLPVELQLKLKEGAQVMMVKNDLQGRWVNGTLGKIKYLLKDKIWIEFSDGTLHEIEQTTWENISYKWNPSLNIVEAEVLGTFTQFPIKLAWAITIHKSQGLTFDSVIIDMGRGAFAHGQLYVALSRCKSMRGITLITKIKSSDMIVDEAVEEFAEKFLREGR